MSRWLWMLLITLIVAGDANAILGFKEPTSILISPAAAVTGTGGILTLKATLKDALGNPVEGKSISWSAIAGTVNPASCVTDARGECTVTYTAPSAEVPEGDVVTASFAGDQNLLGSKVTAIITVKGKIVEKAEAKIPPIVIATEFYPQYFVIGDGEEYKAKAIAVDNTQLKEVVLLYKVNELPWKEVPAEFVSGIPQEVEKAVNRIAQIPGALGYYEAVIPAQNAGAFVRYKFRAVDADGNEMESTVGVYFVVNKKSKTRVMVVDPSMKLWWAKENLLHLKNLTEHFASYMISSSAMERYRELGETVNKYSGYVVQQHHWEMLGKRYNMIVVDHEEMEDALEWFKPDVVVLSNIWLGEWDLSEHGMKKLANYVRENHAGIIATHGTIYEQLGWKKCSRKDARKIGARGQVGDLPEVYINPEKETIALLLGLYPMPLFEYLRDQAAESLCSSPELWQQTAGRVLGSTPLVVPYVPFSGSMIVEEWHPVLTGLPARFSVRIPSAYSEGGIDAYTTVGWQYVLPANLTEVVEERSRIAKGKAGTYLRRVSGYYEEITGEPAAYEEMLKELEGGAGAALARMSVSPGLEAEFEIDGRAFTVNLDEKVVKKLIDRLPVKVVALSDDMLAGIVVNDEWYRKDGHRAVYFSFELEASGDRTSERLLENAVEWTRGWKYTLPELKALAREVYNKTMENAAGVVPGTTVDFAIAISVLQEMPAAQEVKILLGSAAEPEGVRFTRDTMSYSGKTYTSRWGKEDYCLIQPSDGEVNIVGTHRFGTKAGLLYYQRHTPKNTLILRWYDKNGDEDVQLEEVKVIAEY